MNKILDGNAKMKGLKTDAVGEGEEKVLVLEVSIGKLHIGLSLLCKLLAAQDTEIVRKAFWYEDGTRHFFGLPPMESKASFAACDVDISGLKLHDALLHGFKVFIIEAYAAVVEFKITVRDPEDGIGAQLMEKIKDLILIDAIQVPRPVEDKPDSGQHVLDLTRPFYLPAPPVAVDMIAHEEIPDWILRKLYPVAVVIVRSYMVAAVSLVQTKLQVSASVAGRLLEMMEVNGVVSTMNHEGIRTVLDFDGTAHPNAAVDAEFVELAPRECLCHLADATPNDAALQRCTGFVDDGTHYCLHCQHAEQCHDQHPAEPPAEPETETGAATHVGDPPSGPCPDCERMKAYSSEDADAGGCTRWLYPDSNDALRECLAVKANLDASGDGKPEPVDPRLEDAIALVRKHNKCTKMVLQNGLNIGYNRASMLMQSLKDKGVIAVDENGKVSVIPTGSIQEDDGHAD